MDGVIIVVAANVADTFQLSRTNLQAEIVTADTFKPARDIVSQSRSHILIVECPRAEHLQCAGILVNKGEIEPQQVVIDFYGRLFVVADFVDRSIARDDFEVSQ